MPAWLIALLPSLIQALGSSGGAGSFGGMNSAPSPLSGLASPVGGLLGAFGIGGRDSGKRSGHVARTMRWIDGCERYGLGSSVCTNDQIARQLRNMSTRPHYAVPYNRLRALVSGGSGTVSMGARSFGGGGVLRF